MSDGMDWVMTAQLLLLVTVWEMLDSCRPVSVRPYPATQACVLGFCSHVLLSCSCVAQLSSVQGSGSMSGSSKARVVCLELDLWKHTINIAETQIIYNLQVLQQCCLTDVTHGATKAHAQPHNQRR